MTRAVVDEHMAAYAAELLHRHDVNSVKKVVVANDWDHAELRDLITNAPSASSTWASISNTRLNFEQS